jgi:hypothetical protein
MKGDKLKPCWVASMSEDEMIVYLINCKRYEHEKIYGSGAFYDLKTTDLQATQANNLNVGQQCVVATPANNGQIVFSWYSFPRETVMPYKGTPYRVFFGKLIKSDTLSKADAAREGLYSTFFNKNGHFKQISALQR